MLPYYLGTTKIRVSAPHINANAKESNLCNRCSRSTLKKSINPAVICTKGHVQCRECDKVMRHQCRRCGIFTIEGLQHEKQMRNIDPKTMSPEELTQLELNAALNQFKTEFLNKRKKKNLSLNESTSRIIELLNPNLILAYKMCGRRNKEKIEDHLFRTSEKFEHTFEWHRAALEFVMQRLIDLGFYDSYFNISSNSAFRCNSKNNIGIERSAVMKNSNERHEKLRRKLKKYKYHETSKDIKEFNQTKMSEIEEKNRTTSSSDDAKLISVKATKWLISFLCPHCRLNLRLSEFTKHFAIYHCLPIERINIDETKQIYLDSNALLNRSSYPHTLFLVNNCVHDLGGGDFRNYYPIVLIVTTICLPDQTVNNIGTPISQCEIKRKHLMLWLSGIFLADEIQICLKVISMELEEVLQQRLSLNKLYSITSPQCLKDIYESGSMLILSPEILKTITCNGTKSMNLEMTVHIDNTSSM